MAKKGSRAARKTTAQDREWQFKVFFEKSPIAMLICSKEGRFIQTNSAFRKLLGWTEKELKAMTFWDITHPDDLKANKEKVAETHRNTRDSFHITKRYRKKDGGYVWVDLTSNVIRDEKADILYGTAVVEVSKVKLVKEQKEMLDSFITTMAASLDARDELTAGHAGRVTEYALGIARVLGLDSRQFARIRAAGALHDMGKISTPDAVLQKPATLTDGEYKVIKRHATYTHEIVGKIKLPPELSGLPEEAGGHHEWVDGSGYPGGLKGEQIPLVARILAVADVFDAVTSKRHYREAMPIDQALRLIREGAGTHFDPLCVDAFLKYYEKELAWLVKERGALPGLA